MSDELEEKIKNITDSILSGNIDGKQYLSHIPNSMTQLSRRECINLIVRSVFVKKFQDYIERRREELQNIQYFTSEIRKIVNVLCYTTLVYVTIKTLL
jgi:hypothetical protein